MQDYRGVDWYPPANSELVVEVESRIAASGFDRTGTVIFEQDQNSGGYGNTIITTDPDVTGIGALRVVRLSPGGDLGTDLPKAMQDNDLPLGETMELPRGAAPAKFIVEVYRPYSRSLSGEMSIPRIGAPVLRNYGEMRMEPTWTGFVLPVVDLPATVPAQFCADSQQIAISAQRLGYHGLIDIDAIVGLDNRLAYTEFDGRAGGVTNNDTIACRLLGHAYLHSHVLLTRIGVTAPRTPELVECHERTGIHFDPLRRSGVIIAVDDAVTTTIEYLIIGRDKD